MEQSGNRGMGIVFIAEKQQPIQDKVALRG